MNPDRLPILYSFRRCPYAIRARMAIYYSGFTVELREVELSQKPQEMLEHSPKGTVPVLILATGEVIEESREVMQMALTFHDPEGWLTGFDDRELQLGEELIQENDGPFKEHLDHYKYSNRFPGNRMEYHRSRGKDFLQKLEERLENQPCLLGQGLSVADVAIFPFIRQFAFVDKDWFHQLPFPNLQEWFEGLLRSPLYLNVMEKNKPWVSGMEPLLFPELPTCE